jgi:hypothetical protein
MTPNDLSKAPWTQEQVDNLNAFQQMGSFHPFTCGGSNCREVLVATSDGWRCPKCDYTQQWAHKFMTAYTGDPTP